MKVKKSDFTLIREAEQNGLVVSMFNIVKPNRTELNNRLHEYFRTKMPKYLGNFDEVESEVVLEGINEYIEEKGIDMRPLDFPFSSGTDVHLIPINENVQLKVLVADEYYGDGEYAKYVQADYFIINDKTTEKDVDELIDFVNKYLTKYLT